jgi:kynurenine formamidase
VAVAGCVSGATLVGIDAKSVDDPRAEQGFPVYRILFGADILIVEDLINLETLKPGRYYFAFLPLAFAALDGAPVRAIAWTQKLGL